MKRLCLIKLALKTPGRVEEKMARFATTTAQDGSFPSYPRPTTYTPPQWFATVTPWVIFNTSNGGLTIPTWKHHWGARFRSEWMDLVQVTGASIHGVLGGNVR